MRPHSSNGLIFDLILGELGGCPAVADACDVTTTAVHLWRRCGIPEKHWARLFQLQSVASKDFLSPNGLHSFNEEIRKVRT